ncbi:hypothetical protein Tco_1047052 [Tanacetum coccineum]
MGTVASISISGVSQKGLINHSLDGFWSHVVWVGVVRIVAVSDMPGDGSRVHTHDHGGSETPDGSPELILSSEPKPLRKHRPPLPLSILSPGESSYPP